ncbi:hypothetical protein GGQ84_001552 [Desulfitispora alkaliphila]|uniref:hypothetical protein n=1 Tax=Desulfitispora alkaliphila TaxID=622674 RepID=UPI003D207317
MTRRKIAVFMAVIILIISVIVLSNPPLNIINIKSRSFSQYNTESTIFLIGLENKGRFPIRITNVYVNDREVPREAEIAISMEGNLSGYKFAEEREDNPLIKYKPFTEQLIYPQLSFEEINKLRKQDDTEIIRYLHSNYHMWSLKYVP